MIFDPGNEDAALDRLNELLSLLHEIAYDANSILVIGQSCASLIGDQAERVGKQDEIWRIGSSRCATDLLTLPLKIADMVEALGKIFPDRIRSCVEDFDHIAGGEDVPN